MKIISLALSIFLLASCKDKRGCTDRRALNYNEEAEQNTGCRFMSDALAGSWNYRDTGSFLKKDTAGIWHITKYNDSGTAFVASIGIEMVNVSLDTQDYELRVTNKPRLTYCTTTEYIIDTIYSENHFRFSYSWQFKPNEKYSGRVILWK